MPNPIFIQLSQADATTLKNDLNTEIQDAGQGEVIVAVEGQINNYFACIIPKGRESEYNLADEEKKNNFALFSARAQSSEYAGVDFTTAFTTEYNKIYP